MTNLRALGLVIFGAFILATAASANSPIPPIYIKLKGAPAFRWDAKDKQGNKYHCGAWYVKNGYVALCLRVKTPVA